MTIAEVVTRCPECGNERLARSERQPPWCPACEWNLGDWAPPARVKRRRRQRTILRARQEAFAINAALLAELQGRIPDRPVTTRTRAVLTAISIAVGAFDLALLAAGVFAIVAGNWPARIFGLLAVVIALECRPRLPRIDEGFGQLGRADAPALYQVLDEAADALGAPRVDVLVLNDEYNAFCGRSGLRRRVVLGLGLPLWGALSPAGRQALLGHELGHLVNGDPGRNLLTQPALLTFARLADVFDPAKATGRGFNPARDLAVQLLAYPLIGPVHLLCRWLDERVARIAARDHQRAEVYADALAVRLGGQDGAEELMRALVFQRAVWFAVRAAAGEGSADPAEWQRAAAAAVGDRPAAEERLREQESLRYDVARQGTHPPSGLRLRLVRAWPDPATPVPVPVEAMASADAQLSRRYESVRRALLNQTFD